MLREDDDPCMYFCPLYHRTASKHGDLILLYFRRRYFAQHDDDQCMYFCTQTSPCKLSSSQPAHGCVQQPPFYHWSQRPHPSMFLPAAEVHKQAAATLLSHCKLSSSQPAHLALHPITKSSRLMHKSWDPWSFCLARAASTPFRPCMVSFHSRKSKWVWMASEQKRGG